MIKLEEVSEGLSLLKGNNGQQGVAYESQVQSGVGSAVAMMILLPGADVAFVMIAVFDAPVLAGRLGGERFLFGAETGKENAGVVSLSIIVETLLARLISESWSAKLRHPWIHSGLRACLRM